MVELKPRDLGRTLGLAQRRLLLPVVLAVAMGATLVWVAAGAGVRVVEVIGDLSAAEKAMIATAVSSHVDRRFVHVSVSGVRRAIEGLAWTDEVTVRRRWPDRIEISVTKPVPVAHWDEGQVITSRGEVVPVDHAGELPTIRTSLSGPASALAMLQLAKQLTVRTGLDVVALEENSMGEWQFETAGGMRVRLGNQAVPERLKRFESVYREQFHERAPDIEYVDVRYGRGLAVKWRPLVADAGTDAMADQEP